MTLDQNLQADDHDNPQGHMVADVTGSATRGHAGPILSGRACPYWRQSRHPKRFWIPFRKTTTLTSCIGAGGMK